MPQNQSKNNQESGGDSDSQGEYQLRDNPPNIYE